MGMLAWVMMGLAIWHFTIWLPDRFWGGIVGAFFGALLGAALFGLIIHGLHNPRPPRHDDRDRARGDPGGPDRDRAGLLRGRPPRPGAPERRGLASPAAGDSRQRRGAPGRPVCLDARLPWAHGRGSCASRNPRAAGASRPPRRVRAWDRPGPADPGLRPRRRADARARARGQPRPGADARAPRPRRAGCGAGVSRRRRRATSRPRSPGSSSRWSRSSATIAAGGRITVHGDYDVDGVCATAIMVRALRSLGADVGWYLPSRLEDGYGLGRNRQAARGAGYGAADHRRLRDHRGRRGRRRARGRARRGRHRPPCAARRRPAARLPDRASGRLSATRSTASAGRGSRTSWRRRWARAPRTRTSSWSRSRRSPTSCRWAARTGGSSERVWRRSRARPSPACER